MRDEFDKTTKDALAARAGYQCAYPGCTNVTHGPSDESKKAVSNTGMACHIAAASGGSGARRYDSSMSSEQRRSIENGIWLCYTHGKLIDTDETKYSVETLKKWKEIAERKAQIRQAYGDKHTIIPEMLYEIGLPKESLSIPGIGEENCLIGELLRNSQVDELWGGEVAHAIRDLSIELVRNAFQHGGATQFKIIVNHKSIELYDDGGDYSIWDLYRNSVTSGGTIAAQHVVNCLKFRLLIVADRFDSKNHTLLTLVNDPDEISYLTECSVDINWNQLKRRELPYQVHELCRSKCIVLPPYFAISDCAVLRDMIPIDDGRPVVFVLSETSPKAQEVLEGSITRLSQTKDPTPNPRGGTKPS